MNNMRIYRQVLSWFRKGRRDFVQTIIFLFSFLIFFLLTQILLLARCPAQPLGVGGVCKSDNSYTFYFRGQSGILLLNYKDNIKEFNRMTYFINHHTKELKSGKSHLNIVTYILPSDLKNPHRMNDALVQASVVRAYIKIHNGIGHYACSCTIDTSRVLRNIVRVDYLPYPVLNKNSKHIYYTLNRNDSNSIMRAVGRNDIISFLQAKLPRYKKKSLYSKVFPSKDSISANPILDFLIVQDSVLLVKKKQALFFGRNVEKKSGDFGGFTKKTFVPFLGVKTNLLYWAGITPEVRYRDFMPNIELEWYITQRLSLNLEFIRTYCEKMNTDREIWALSSMSAEPRFWFNSDRKYSGLYVGIYGLKGDFDVKLNSLSSNGYTGDFYESGFSLGYYQPLSSHWGVELGGRCGYRSVSGDIYNFSDPHYYKQSSFTQSGFKLTGLSFLVTYRFGKNIKNKTTGKQ
jgi:hypothetical protein